MIYDRIQNFTQYFHNDKCKIAFDFMMNQDEKSDPGTYELYGDDIYAMITSYETVHPENAILEAHRKYVDIQVVLSGIERIGCFHIDEVTVRDDYNDEKDVVFFNKPNINAPVSLEMKPGYFTVLLPQDAHSPQLMVGAKTGAVKKMVIKIKRDLLD